MQLMRLVTKSLGFATSMWYPCRTDPAERHEAQNIIDTRYKKLSVMHAGAIYVVIAPYSKVERHLQWMLHMENNDDEKCIVSEEEPTNSEFWKPLS